MQSYHNCEASCPPDHAEDILTAKQEWGLCKDCKWWQVEPKARVENLSLGLGIEEKLQPFRLGVSGNSGCNRFMPGKPARAKASSEAPPVAEPVR
ncbi:MAG TPA: hypothetical protein VGG61_07475 [Gemmataceae bacterium]